MKKILVLIFLVFVAIGKAQTCVTPTVAPDYIFYPFSTINFTFAPTPSNFYYLCGPNTTVYDTTGNGTCHTAIVNSGSTLIFKPKTCPGSGHMFYIKNNGVLNLLPGTMPVYVQYEPLASINNATACPTTTLFCNSIVISPTVSCSMGINKITNSPQDFLTWPNPTSNTLHFKSEQNEFENLEIEISNSVGQIVLKLPYSNSIDVSKLTNSFYNIKISVLNKPVYYSKFIKE